VTSIAHPSHYPNHFELVPRLFDLGIDGVEVSIPTSRTIDRERFTTLARFRGKMTTGGSDDHGTVKTSETLGTFKCRRR
jgi:predicted metal-dependent phosphoesterase TrpH